MIGPVDGFRYQSTRSGGLLYSSLSILSSFLTILITAIVMIIFGSTSIITITFTVIFSFCVLSCFLILLGLLQKLILQLWVSVLGPLGLNQEI